MKFIIFLEVKINYNMGLRQERNREYVHKNNLQENYFQTTCSNNKEPKPKLNNKILNHLVGKPIKHSEPFLWLTPLLNSGVESTEVRKFDAHEA